jgi:putative methionine-R-sulfoxide reductase with GAF domain
MPKYNVLIPYLEKGTGNDEKKFEVEYSIEAGNWTEALRKGLNKFEEAKGHDYHSWVCTVMKDIVTIRDLETGRTFHMVDQQVERQEFIRLVEDALLKTGTGARGEIIENKLLEEDAFQALFEAEDKAKGLKAVLDLATEALLAEAGSILLVDSRKKDLYFAAANGSAAEKIMKYRLKMGQGLAGWCAEHRNALMIGDVRKDPRFYSRISEELGFKTDSILAVPLILRGRALGIFELVNSNKDGGFTPDDVRTLEKVARACAMFVAGFKVTR